VFVTFIVIFAEKIKVKCKNLHNNCSVHAAAVKWVNVSALLRSEVFSLLLINKEIIIEIGKWYYKLAITTREYDCMKTSSIIVFALNILNANVLAGVCKHCHFCCY